MVVILTLILMLMLIVIVIVIVIVILILIEQVRSPAPQRVSRRVFRRARGREGRGRVFPAAVTAAVTASAAVIQEKEGVEEGVLLVLILVVLLDLPDLPLVASLPTFNRARSDGVNASSPRRSSPSRRCADDSRIRREPSAASSTDLPAPSRTLGRTRGRTRGRDSHWRERIYRMGMVSRRSEEGLEKGLKRNSKTTSTLPTPMV